MSHWYKRWFRWLTNPAPMPGELWQLEGMGTVEVLSTFKRSRFVDRSQDLSTVGFRTQGGERFTWSAGAFLERGEPGAPSGLLQLRNPPRHHANEALFWKIEQASHTLSQGER